MRLPKDFKLPEGAKSLGVHIPGLDAIPKPSKYRSAPKVYGGVRYDSSAEADRARDLDLMVASGSVFWWIGQPKFSLGVPENRYRPDFLVVTPNDVHVEDVKGFATRKFIHDSKLWRKYGACELWVITRKGVEIIVPENPGAFRLRLATAATIPIGPE